MNHLRARFLPQFVETARGRARRLLELLSAVPPDADRIRREFHALAGEAAVLGFREIEATARAGEVAAQRWQLPADPEAMVACTRAQRAVVRGVEELVAPSRPRPRALVIDDSAINAEVIGEALTSGGFDVEVVTEGSLEELIARVAARAPAVVIVDVQIGAVAGDQLCARLRERAATSAVRAILVSALARDRLREVAAACGCADAIEKAAGVGAIVARARALAGIEP